MTQDDLKLMVQVEDETLDIELFADELDERLVSGTASTLASISCFGTSGTFACMCSFASFCTSSA